MKLSSSLFRKGALLRWSALLFLVPSVAQTPARPPQLYSYHLLPGDKDWSWKSIVVDSPLVLTRDVKGQAHIGVDPKALSTLGNCFISGTNNDEMTCRSFTASDPTNGSIKLVDRTTGHTVTITVPSGLSKNYVIQFPQIP